MTAALLPLAGVLLAGPITDQNRDGRVVVLCLGDSNTQFPVRGNPRLSWCELAAETFAPVRWKFRNGGLWNTGVDAAPGILAQMIEVGDRPDAVILAYGSNDLIGQVPVEEIVRRYEKVVDQVRGAGATPFVALVPPILAPGGALNRPRDELNVALRTYFAGMIIDFASIMVYPDDYENWLHMNQSGQLKRAQAAVEALLNVPRAQ